MPHQFHIGILSNKFDDVFLHWYETDIHIILGNLLDLRIVLSKSKPIIVNLI